ncbi:DNA alkylation repair protein [Ornithinibacillus contaminans]|uniref:DNA alkylation repair protein n=1 Tax=Ornithinibacillus contaminans TaxID=694055 RepID=UPI00064D995D|nr:DNA alkylation repair protein [Ornithinibacillus contaminans]
MYVLKKLTEALEANRNDENAVNMERYMKNQFSFYGIKTPERRIILLAYFHDSGILTRPFQPAFVLALWKQDEREYQNIALDYIEKSLPKLNKNHLELFEKLIVTKSWWDTVDVLAPKAVGKLAMEHPEIITETIDAWSTDSNKWLRRAAILFQLKYKEKTDQELLYRYIKESANSEAFFIQKAIGWALREYSKTNPESVRHFISNNELAKLSIREGSKYLH